MQACLNGSRRPGAHAALPLRPEEVGLEARRAVDAGAAALHVHPRGDDGAETLDPAAVGAAVAEVRRRCPGVPVGVTTGAWIEPDPARREELVGRWEVRPDHASVNFSEPGAVELAAALLGRGVGVEAGVWDVEDAHRLVTAGLASSCVRVLLEPREDEPGPALATAAGAEAVLAAAGVPAPRLLHGRNGTAWPVLVAALERGFAVRIGLEDVLTLPDGRPTPGNAELVAAARELARRHGRA